MQRPTWPRALLALALVGAAPFVQIRSAEAAAAHATGITGPTAAPLAKSIGVTIDVTNTSTAPETDAGHSISDIFLTPSCGSSGPDAAGMCPSADVGVAAPSASGVGASGTACEGETFTISPEAGSTTGRHHVIPTSPVLLAPPSPDDSDRCTIEFQLTIQRMPSEDALPAPGVQTVVLASSVGTSNIAAPGEPNSTSFSAGAAAITITPGEPTLTTQVVDEEVPLGEPVADSATLTGGASPTGAVTFDLYGPDDEDCSGEPVASTTQPVDGAGTYTSPAALPDEPGQYRFVARYSGDDDDLPVSGSCNDPNESVAVTAAEPPGLRVRNEATPLSRPEPGGTFAFDVDVTNTSAVRLTLTGLADDIYGDLSTQGTCTDAVGTVLAPGDTYTCAFSGELTGNAGTTQTSVVTGDAVDDEGTAVADDDDATISLTDVPPTTTVAKTALPEEQAAPGGLFTFGLEVTNTSAEPVTVTGLTDDSYGDLAQMTGSSCSELLGATLAPGETRTCTFTGELTGEVGATHTNIVTITVTDDEGSVGTAKDDATIRLVAPDATTTSTVASPTTAPRATTTTAAAGRTSLASTGDRTRTRVVQALLLVGAGMVLTGLGQGRTTRHPSQ